VLSYCGYVYFSGVVGVYIFSFKVFHYAIKASFPCLSCHAEPCVIALHDEAVKLFENIARHVNKLGLLSEDIDRETGELLGNFPQAYSHIALINTAIHIYD